MSEDAVKEAIKSIFVAPEVVAKVVETVVPGKRPAGWSRKSNATYYNEHCALQLKQVLDAMSVDRQDRIYRYDEWKHLSPTTVYIRINQSLNYLLDRLDPDKKYKDMCQRICIRRSRQHNGVVIQFLEEYRATDTSSFLPSAVIPNAQAPKWKDKMEKWIEESVPGDKPFVQENLMLSNDDIRELKLQFAGVKNIAASITARSVKLIKIVPQSL